MEGGDQTNYIGTSHVLAKELLNKPDGFITVSLGELEYIIDSLKRVSTHANVDDSTIYWTLKLREIEGNIKR